MAVRGVDHDSVHIGLIERGHAFHRVMRHADPGGYPQAAFSVFAGVRVGLYFGDVFVRQQADQPPFVIHHGQLLDFVLQQDIRSVFQVGIVRGDQFVLGHHIVDRALHVALEPQVAVRYDADQRIVRGDHGNSADVVLFHQLQRIAYRIVFADGDRVVDHTVLGALHLAHLGGLVGDRHIFVDYADSSFAGDSDGHVGFRHGIHGCRNDRRVDGHVA